MRPVECRGWMADDCSQPLTMAGCAAAATEIRPSLRAQSFQRYTSKLSNVAEGLDCRRLGHSGCLLGVSFHVLRAASLDPNVVICGTDLGCTDATCCGRRWSLNWCPAFATRRSWARCRSHLLRSRSLMCNRRCRDDSSRNRHAVLQTTLLVACAVWEATASGLERSV